MLDNGLTKKILNILLKNGADFSEIFVQKRVFNNLRLDDGKIEKSSSGYEVGCGLRLWIGDSTFYAFVDSLEKEKLINAAKVLSSALNGSSSLKVLNLNESESSYASNIKKPPSGIYPGKKKEILEIIDKNSRNYSSKIIQVTSVLSDVEEDIFIANSYGSYSSEKMVRTFLAVNVVARRGNNAASGYKSIARTGGYEMFDLKDPAILAKDASGIAVNMIDAINAPTGEIPVVIGPAFGGVIFHEACGHGLEADAVMKDASVFKGMIGKKIAGEEVSAVDDSTIKYHWGSYKFDGEGFPSRKTVLIKDGVLENYLYDLRTSKKMKGKQTGNGRRQSFRHVPIPRMSNTYIESGKEDPESIIKSVSKGIYAKEFAGGQVDPATGDFVFGISEGYMIENGKLGSPIKGATLIGNGMEILKKIEAVGNNLDFAPGFCGKSGQSVSNEVGQPTIKVSKITVGGIKDRDAE
ncbi:MAG: TldD/PmbA family protein [Actinomycetota bacterium]|nr:TldD/PmbA family protein [Actinomycetota bacterium]